MDETDQGTREAYDLGPISFGGPTRIIESDLEYELRATCGACGKVAFWRSGLAQSACPCGKCKVGPESDGCIPMEGAVRASCWGI